MTIIEKIIAKHCGKATVTPGEIVDIAIDARLARDFGGANVVKNIERNGLDVDDRSKTFFTFDCNPTGSDQKYAANQQYCREFARNQGIQVYDINSGIGTHLAIDQGLVVPGDTLVSTDSHANILGAIGCFGQGMGDRDIAAAWSSGSVWFKVPESVRLHLIGEPSERITAKDIVLNLLRKFGASTLLGYAVEITGRYVDQLSLDDRITIASMGTEMGAIVAFFTPSEEILDYCKQRSGKEVVAIKADPNAIYAMSYEINMSYFDVAIARPGKPHDVVRVKDVEGVKIDSAFIGSCTIGRMSDMRRVARVLKNKKVCPRSCIKDCSCYG